VTVPAGKRRVVLVDDYGEHVAALYLPSDSLDFEDAELEGLSAGGLSMLRGRSFARSCLYWASLSDADLSGCNFEGCDLRGANLKGARLVNANLRGANLGLDNLGGGTWLQGADLTDAVLNGCVLVGALYDDRTRFPRGFSPEAARMVDVEHSAKR